MSGVEFVQRNQQVDENQALRLKHLTTIAENAYFSALDPALVAKNAEALDGIAADTSRESLQLEPTQHNLGLHRALWTLNTYKLSAREDGYFVAPGEATLKDWEVPAPDRRLARVSLGEWRLNKKSEMLYDANDMLRMYLKQIGGVKLLSAEDEVELAKAIEVGLYAGHKLDGGKANKGERLSIDERRNFAELALMGKDAYDHFYEANLRLVVSIAKKYSGKGMPLLDIIQEGNLGLKHAIDKFDYTLGIKFSVYASRWIKQAIQAALPAQSRMISITKHENAKLQKLVTQRMEFEKEHDRRPTNDELIQLSDLEADQVNALLNNFLRNHMSLDQRVGEREDRLISDLLVDNNDPMLEDIVVTQDNRRMLDEALCEELNALKDIKRIGEKATIYETLMILYGIGNGERKTQMQTASLLGVGRNAVQESERAALDRLRQSDTLRSLYNEQ